MVMTPIEQAIKYARDNMHMAETDSEETVWKAHLKYCEQAKLEHDKLLDEIKMLKTFIIKIISNQTVTNEMKTDI